LQEKGRETAAAEMIEFQRYVLSRLAEASTWRGLVLLGTSFALFTYEQGEAILQFGLAVAGAIGAIFPDYKA
jgi:hypothetical protein